MKERKVKTRNNVSSAPPSDDLLPSGGEVEQAGLNLFPIVGVGASAGGLQAFSRMLRALPADPGMAFIYIQHLDPQQTSYLTQLLARESKMEVEVATDTEVQPNKVYVIPPKVALTIQNGNLRLQLRPLADRPHLAVDVFFRSLADDQRSRAIGIVLSGTGSDGALGIQAIKAEGGITFAQAPESAEYDGMPQAAIASGAVDLVLAPERIVDELISIRRHGYIALTHPNEVDVAVPDGAMKEVLGTIRPATSVDFTDYKQSTIKRRVMRRMAVHKLHTLEEYVAYLKQHSEEVQALYNDMLIAVTSFFRDPETFDALKERVFPLLLKNREPNAAVRFWVPACASGEEVYSLAIALAETREYESVRNPVKIFGSDINEAAIVKARLGIYPASIANEVSLERLRRFFTQEQNSYQVSKWIREMCTFARHNILSDPPFSNLDLVSCRNLLIYFGPALQRRVFPILNYALKSSGYLMLGSSETVGVHENLFSLVDKKHKIYLKRSASTRLPYASFPAGVRAESGRAITPAEQAPTPVTGVDLSRQVERLIINKYAPPGVVVNDQMQIQHFCGQTSEYLEHVSGAADLDLLKMAKPGLATHLRAALQKARAEKATVIEKGVRTRTDGKSRVLDIEVTPVGDIVHKVFHYLVLFHSRKEPVRQPAAPPSREDPGEIEQLRQELIATRDYLQSNVEEREAANEELRSANEEIQSTNEEIQSTNEELETAREELQATNEELNTVNDDLKRGNAELAQSNDDLQNLLTSVNIPIVMVGSDLRIRRFTPQAEKLLNLIPSDIGRPIGHVKSNLQLAQLESMLLDAIESLRSSETEVQDNRGAWYLLRIRPYRTVENKIDGAVLAIVDIDRLKTTLDRASTAEDLATTLSAIMPDPVLALYPDLRIKSVNTAFCTQFQVSGTTIIGVPLFSIAAGMWDTPQMHHLLEKALPEAGQVENYEVHDHFPLLGDTDLLVNARSVMIGSERQFILAFSNVTASRRAQRLIEASASERESQLYSRATDLEDINVSLQREVARRQASEATMRESRDALSSSEAQLRALAYKLLTVQDEERRRMAGILHDAVNQQVVVLGVHLIQLEREIQAPSVTAQKTIEALRNQISTLSDEIKYMMQDLHPAVLDDLGLTAALRSLFAAYKERERVEVNFDHPEARLTLPGSVAYCLYRLVQEALSNVAKHSGATEVFIRLTSEDKHVGLSIKDRGRGFDPNIRRTGLGLVTMRERVRSIGGDMKVTASPGDGTQIDVNVPLSAEGDKE